MDNHSTPVEIVIDEVEMLGSHPARVKINLHSYAHWLPEHNVMITGVEIQNLGDLPPFKHRDAGHYKSKLEGIRHAMYGLDSKVVQAKLHYQEITKPAEPVEDQAALTHRKHEQWSCEQCGKINEGIYIDCAECGYNRDLD